MTVRMLICWSFLFLIPVACHPLRQAEPYTLVGTWHTVSSTDTLQGVAQKYRVSANAIQELNDLANDRDLRGRTMVFIPRGSGDVPGRGRSGAFKSIGIDPLPKTAQADTPKKTPSKQPTSECGKNGKPCLLWPADGKIVTRFGKKDAEPHDGIDIKGPKGSPIKAAGKGRVLYSGNQIKGYGNLVIIRHESGLITVYAHNDKNIVKEGDNVAAGDKIAEMGQTGIAEFPHLHFEVRKAEQPTDPLMYLPR